MLSGGIESFLIFPEIFAQKISYAILEILIPQKAIKNSEKLHALPESPLMPFHRSAHTSIHNALPFTREDYFALVDETGRCIRNDKRGFINASSPSILQKFGINPEHWLAHVQRFGMSYGYCAGSRDNILDYATSFARSAGKDRGKAVSCVYQNC